MDSDNSPENFAKQKKSVIVAPAGYGKTELIARSVECCKGRQLVLTHTHAGVDSLRKRFKKYNIPSSQFSVETIHSFALRFAGSYPKTTKLPFEKPAENKDYNQVISSAINLFDIKLGKDILRNSYSGIFVDEYQDCQVNQHELICKLADVLSCRIVGDPLQGIYDFGDNQIVDWDDDVFTSFDRLPDLETPYRWNETNPTLGTWLHEVRLKINDKKSIAFDSNSDVIYINDDQEQLNKCLNGSLSFNGTKFVICEPQNINKPHSIAKSMKNKYRTIEPLTSKELCEYAEKIESTQHQDRLNNVIGFAEKCLTAVKTDCNSVRDNLNGNFRNWRKIALKKHFKNICNNDELQYIYYLFKFFEDEYKPTYKRYQLWQEMKKGLQEVALGNYDSLEEAVWQVRNQSRFRENRIPKRCISRTVLLKGLECKHAIIVNPELFDAKNLYVALTRASSKLTIISNNQTWCNYPCNPQ